VNNRGAKRIVKLCAPAQRSFWNQAVTDYVHQQLRQLACSASHAGGVSEGRFLNLHTRMWSAVALTTS
jgi:hypothetical protein